MVHMFLTRAVALIACLAADVSAQPGPLPAQSAAMLSDPLASEAARSDAWLAGVCFVDPEYGWAVGDRGTIWHTQDGGKRWQLQNTPVQTPLTSVSFVNRQVGWAVGGQAQPLGEGSNGIVLWTGDGGATWQGNPKLPLPALRKVAFFNERYGWALGSTSSMFPSGLFVSDTGGRSWQPLPAGAARGWLAGSLLDPSTGALAGRMGALVTIQRGSFEPSQTVSLGLRAVHELTLVPPLYGWLVGDGGLVMLTADLGRTWQTPPGGPSQDVAGHFDFRAMAVRGPKCWVAGSPGTRVFHSPDAGRTWQVFPTGQQSPLEALTMIDDQHGWAVGALGTILATDDGGQNWKRQRSGGTRAALLGLFAEPGEVPLELFARLSGNEGYLGIVSVIARRDVETQPRQSADLPERLQQAVVSVGGSGAEMSWQFPLRQSGLKLSAEQVFETWDRANDGHGMQNLHAYLVRQIRLWRPEVVVTSGPATGGDPAGTLVQRCVAEALQEAADPTRFPEQITMAGLEPWAVKKLYAVLPPGASGTVDLSTGELAPRLGRSLYEVTATPRALLDTETAAPPPSLGFQLLGVNLPDKPGPERPGPEKPRAETPGRSDFFTGIVLQPGGEARRQLLDPATENLDAFKRLALRRKNVQTIFELSRQGDKGLNLLGQAADTARQLDPDGGAWLLYHLAQRYHRTGQWEMAAEAYGMLADRYPEHFLARTAMIWMVQYYSSSEAAWRVQGKNRYTVGQVSTLAFDPAKMENRSRRAMEIATRLEQTQPAAFAEPALRFPLATAHRQEGFPRQADRFYLGVSRGLQHDAWWACAESERWLGEPKGVPAKPVLTCVLATTKPRLDGKLDDPLWQQARPAVLQSPHREDAQWPARVMLAYDRQYLYVAVSCRQAAQCQYDASPGPRPRDPDLEGHDRVDILLDLDRDYVTYYKLSIDHRGWVAESCWGDPSWNPQWFVAAGAEEGTWTAEAAIPFEQLTRRFPTARDVWAVGIQRVVPGVGFQSWSQPASTEVVPEGFGLLIFN